METSLAARQDNLFMGKEECTNIFAYLHLIYFWKRSIDDIFFMFLGSHTQLETLMDIMNTINQTIKYSFTYSKQAISFLAVQVYLFESKKLKRKLYKNPTDSMTRLPLPPPTQL